MTKQLKLDHVERLSRGKRSGRNIGSRSVGHYLRPHERSHYQRALKRGYLDINEKDRANLWHIWEKACAAQDWTFLVLIKRVGTDQASIYQNNELLSQHSLKEAKTKINKLAKERLNVS